MSSTALIPVAPTSKKDALDPVYERFVTNIVPSSEAQQALIQFTQMLRMETQARFEVVNQGLNQQLQAFGMALIGEIKECKEMVKTIDDKIDTVSSTLSADIVSAKGALNDVAASLAEVASQQVLDKKDIDSKIARYLLLVFDFSERAVSQNCFFFFQSCPADFQR